ncbi:hypothetical protein [Streptomyces lavendulocolor]|uniref:hypothetical protein n=1 Tax=Streptomyces lavendulocolor TaxID=67316 RepID=UPI003C2B3BD3
MPLSRAPVEAYAASVESLAECLEKALRDPVSHDGVVAGHVRRAADAKAALAAVRVLGPDVFAPALLAGRSPGPLDREVVAEALRVFPVAPGEPVESMALAEAQAALVTRPHRSDARPGPHPAQDTSSMEDDTHWVPFTQLLARMSPLALPGCETALAGLARRRALDVSRGVVRAMLRRDHPTAARLARWSALVHAPGPAEAALRPEPVVGHLVQCGTSSARMALDVAVLQRLTGPARQGER